jgi:hypothetical protein
MTLGSCAGGRRPGVCTMMGHMLRCGALHTDFAMRKTDTDRALSEEFLAAVEGLLHRHPAGLSEHQLLRLLHDAGYLPFLGASPWEPHALFCAHFLLFHALYRLRDRSWQAQQAHLEIRPLNIRWQPYQDGQGGLARPDTLREYYLDLANLEQTSARDVDALLAAFWGRFQRHDQRAEALLELGLSDPVDDATIKRTYRQLVMRHHPDRGGETARLQVINAALRVLLGSG